ncbi:Alpha-mannosidase I MNS5-like protein [Drosera capensis]
MGRCYFDNIECPFAISMTGAPDLRLENKKRVMRQKVREIFIVMGNYTEFEKAVRWLSHNLSFDVDARVNLFEYGVMENKTAETSNSGCGSLILEMRALSGLTGDPRYETEALHALRTLWSMRRVDSFYEYLIKAYILFGKEEYWRMFHSAHIAAQKHLRHGPRCKYLYLLFDDSFLAERNYVCTTEGHPLPVRSDLHDRLPETFFLANYSQIQIQGPNRVRRASALSQQLCPATKSSSSGGRSQMLESACHIPDARSDYRCSADEDCGVDATTCRWRS